MSTHPTKRHWLFIACAGMALAGCLGAAARTPGMIVSPADPGAEARWSEGEKQADVVLRNLRESPEASFHLLRVRTELKLRKHEKSDLVMVIVAGRLELELGNRRLPAAPGDVIEVPRGVPYGATAQGGEPGVIYMMYTPGLDPNDTRVTARAPAESSWKWNLWAQ